MHDWLRSGIQDCECADNSTAAMVIFSQHPIDISVVPTESFSYSKSLLTGTNILANFNIDMNNEIDTLRIVSVSILNSVLLRWS